MIILLDIGNSRVKMAELKGEGVVQQGIFDNPEELFEAIDRYKPESIWVSSVVPDYGKTIKERCSGKAGVNLISHRSNFSFRIAYRTPETLGTDRLCGMEGALFYAERKGISIENKRVVTIDLGTATTINIMNERREFTGGTISPGVFTMIGSLTTNTAQLPGISDRGFILETGYDTETCIGSGVLNSQIGLIEKVLGSVSKGGAVVFVTGGNYLYLHRFLRFEHIHVPDLILRGVGALCLRTL